MKRKKKKHKRITSEPGGRWNLLWLCANGRFRVRSSTKHEFIDHVDIKFTKKAFGLVNIFKRIKYAACLVISFSHPLLRLLLVDASIRPTINVLSLEMQDTKPKANENEINFPLRSFFYSGISRSDVKISSKQNKRLQWGYCVCVLSFRFGTVLTYFLFFWSFEWYIRCEGGMLLPAASSSTDKRLQDMHVCYNSSAFTAAFFRLAPFCATRCFRYFNEFLSRWMFWI